MKLHINDPRTYSGFIQRNEEWISRFFKIEDADRKLAQDPGKIVEQGGYIFCFVEEGDVKGTVALFILKPDEYELARMAVAPDSQGQGLGNRLMRVALEKLQALRAGKVILLSNTKLKPALSLYHKFGFKTEWEGQHPDYARCDIVLAKFPPFVNDNS